MFEPPQTGPESAYTYRISGLRVSSDILLRAASLCEEPGESHEVSIRRSPVPDRLPHPESTGPDWEMEQDSFLLRVEGVSRFLIRSGTSILVDPEAGHDPGELALYLLGTCFATLLQQRGAIVLHASGIAVGAKAVLFCGASGAGKSTMAALLCQNGYALLNDDVCTIAYTEGKGYHVLPDTRKLKLWGASVQGLSLTGSRLSAVSGRTDKYFVAPMQAEIHNDRPIGAIYILEEAQPGEPVSITRLNALEATVQLKLNAYRLALVLAMGQQETYFRASLAFQQDSGVFRLRRVRDFQNTGELLRTLQAHWGSIGLQDPNSMLEDRQLSGVR